VVWLGTFDIAIERPSCVTQTAGECEGDCERARVSVRGRLNERERERQRERDEGEW
jgi:hypothetical protein